MKTYLIERLQEPSTWRGIAMFAVACGVGISPEQINAIVTVGLMIIGIMGAATKDKP